MAKARKYYYVSNKRVQNDNKVKQAIKNFAKLLEREKKEGETAKWMKKEKEKAANRLRKYSIKPESVTV